MPTNKRPIEQSAVTELGPGRSATVAGFVLVALLLAISLGLALQGGAYGPSAWLPMMAAVAGIALMMSIAGPAVSSSRTQKLLLAIFVLQAVWTAASLLWAGSRSNAWEETNRTLFYALAIVLVFAAVRWTRSAGLKAVAAAVTALAGAVGVFVLITFVITDDPLSLFISGRLNYPITYFNGLAALLMVGFWLALGMASGARCPRALELQDLETEDSEQNAEATQSRVAWRRAQINRRDEGHFGRWTQPLLLALAVILVEVALLPQSRGALWTFFLVLPFFVILSPNRFRALIDVVIVIAPVVLFWGRLNAPYLAITAEEPLDPALQTFLITVGYSVAAVVGAWLVTWLIERLIGPLRRRVAMWIGVALASLAILAAAGGIVYADIRTGGLDGYFSDRWQELTADSVGDSEGATRFTGVGLNGRLRQWEVAADAFLEEPALGLGAQNFEYYWYEHRPVGFAVRQPHSQPMQLLSELGLPGALLWLAFIAAALIYAATVRFRSSRWGTRVVVAAIMTAVISWFIHSSADWLWQLAGVSLPAMMLLGALIGADRGRETSKAFSTPTATEAPLEAEHPGPTHEATNATALAGDEASESGEALGAPKPRRGESTEPRLRRSPVARTIAVAVALAALASAALPYVSLRYSAMAAGAADLQQAADRADTAASLDPTSIQPYSALAGAYMSAASAAPNAQERLRLLRLAVAAWQQALEREPGSWICQFGAAEALVEARSVALAVDITIAQELAAQARIHLTEAQRLNPLSPEIDDLQQVLDRLGSSGPY